MVSDYFKRLCEFKSRTLLTSGRLSSATPPEISSVNTSMDFLKKKEQARAVSISNTIRNSINVNTTINITVKNKNYLSRNLLTPLNIIQSYADNHLLKKNLFISDYEWYLQTSRFKEFCNVNRYIAGLLKKHENFYNPFTTLLFGGRLSAVTKNLDQEIFSNTFFVFQNRQELLKNLNATAPQIKNAATSDSQVNIYKNINADTAGHGGIKIDSSVIQKNINIDSIVDRVSKNLEEKLRYDRLKKGLF